MEIVFLFRRESPENLAKVPGYSESMLANVGIPCPPPRKNSQRSQRRREIFLRARDKAGYRDYERAVYSVSVIAKIRFFKHIFQDKPVAVIELKICFKHGGELFS